MLSPAQSLFGGTGAGDRLGLKCEVTGEGLPVAVLPYCGRPLLQSLIRDVQAREFLYYKLHGVQQMTPIAIMTSDAKDNHRRVTDFIAACDWFGRGKESFRSALHAFLPFRHCHADVALHESFRTFTLLVGNRLLPKHYPCLVRP